MLPASTHMKLNAACDDSRENRRLGRRSFRQRSCSLGGMIYPTLSVVQLLLLVPRSSWATAAPALSSAGRALSSSDTIQASSSSFELMLIPDSAQTSEAANGNSNRRRGSYSLKKELSELIQNAIASTIMSSGRCESQDAASGGSEAYSGNTTGTGRLSYCPYQSMVVKIERAEWTRPEDPLTLRFYVVATIRSDQDYAQKRSQSSSFDLRQELDAFVLDFFYGDLFLATILKDWSDDQDEDEVITHAMMANVHLQVSESQSRIYQTRSPTASVVFLAVAFVLVLFVVDGVVRYATPVQLCIAPRSRQDMSDFSDDGPAVERQTLNNKRGRELV